MNHFEVQAVGKAERDLVNIQYECADGRREFPVETIIDDWTGNRI